MKPSELSQAYTKYLGPKCSRTTFYSRIRKGMSISEAIKPISYEDRYKPGTKVFTSRFKEEMERYHQQSGEKVSRSRFYQRLYQGWKKEEAIKVGYIPVHHIKKKGKKKPIYQRPAKIPLLKDIKVEEDTNVKYQEEEAKAIAKEYERMIEDLRAIYYETDDLVTSKDIAEKIEKLEKEYKDFIFYNK